MQTSAAAFNHKKRLGNPEKKLADAITGKEPELQGNGFDPTNLPNYTGPGSNKIPQAPQVAITEPTPAAPSTKDFLTSIMEGGNTRYSPVENTAKPERDVELEEKIKRRAKMNLIAKAIGSVGQLGGMAAGGDATRLEDGVTPWNLNQLQTADADYRDQLRGWIDRGFQVDMYNNRLGNQQASEDYETGVRQDQAEQKAKNDALLADQRAQAAVDLLKSKSLIEQREEMQKVGINPDDPKAFDLYLDLNRKKNQADVGLVKARTNSYNRLGSTKTGKTPTTFDLESMRKGRDAMIQDEQRKLKGLDSIEDAESIKAINERIKSIQNHNPGSNELLDADILKRASSIGAAQSKGMPDEFNPDKYMANQPAINVKTEESLRTGYAKLTSPDFQKLDQVSQGQVFDQIIRDMMEGGYVQSEEEAEAYILEILEGDN